MTLWNGEIVAGGDFLYEPGESTLLNHVAQWTGGSWSPLDAGLDALRALHSYNFV